MNGYSPLHNTNMPPTSPQRAPGITKYIVINNHHITAEKNEEPIGTQRQGHVGDGRQVAQRAGGSLPDNV